MNSLGQQALKKLSTDYLTFQYFDLRLYVFHPIVTQTILEIKDCYNFNNVEKKVSVLQAQFAILFLSIGSLDQQFLSQP